MWLSLLTLSSLANPPSPPNFGADALVSSVAANMQLSGSTGIAGNTSHANLVWTPGSFAEVCLEKKAGSTGRTYTFSVVYGDGGDKPDMSNPVWTGPAVASSVTGAELVCSAFASGTEVDPSQFVGGELVVDAGEQVWLVVTSSAGSETGLVFGEVPQSGPVVVRRKVLSANGVASPIRAAVDLGSGFVGVSSGAALIYLVDQL